jgi:hypothetical protein
MKRKYVIALILLFLIFLVFDSDRKEQAVISKLEAEGITNVVVEYKTFRPCCDGIFNGCKNSSTYEYIGLKNSVPVKGRACYRNCIMGEQVMICE